MKKICLFLIACVSLMFALTSCGGSSGTEITSAEEWSKAFEGVLDVNTLDTKTANSIVAKATNSLDLKSSVGFELSEEISYALDISLPSEFDSDTNITSDIKTTIKETVSDAEKSGKGNINVKSIITPIWSAQYTKDYKSVKLNKDDKDSVSIPGAAVEYIASNNTGTYSTTMKDDSTWVDWSNTSSYASVYTQYKSIYECLAAADFNEVKKSYSKGKYTVTLYMGIDTAEQVPVFYSDSQSKKPEVKFIVKFNEDKKVCYISLDEDDVSFKAEDIFGQAVAYLGTHAEKTKVTIDMSLEIEIDYLSKETTFAKQVPALSDAMTQTQGTGDNSGNGQGTSVTGITLDGAALQNAEAAYNADSNKYTISLSFDSAAANQTSKNITVTTTPANSEFTATSSDTSNTYFTIEKTENTVKVTPVSVTPGEVAKPTITIAAGDISLIIEVTVSATATGA